MLRGMRIVGQDTGTTIVKLSLCWRWLGKLTIRGPALNGKNMNGLGWMYVFARSSKKRSGSHVLESGPQYDSFRCIWTIENVTL